MINRAYVVTLLAVLALAAVAHAQTFTVLYNFTGGSDGFWPDAGVTQDRLGDLYGTTSNDDGVECTHGYYYDCGVVFKVNSAGTETVLHNFSYSDGAFPSTPVVRDKAGNIYGTTSSGGSAGYGVVFKIDTEGNETVLHSFAGGTSDGCGPDQGLHLGKSGTLFGTTNECGSSGYGTIFKIDSAGNETVLHSFNGPPSDGANPSGGHLTMDKSGNLYGLTKLGGASSYGVLYMLSECGTFSVLHSFNGGTKDGCYPFGSVSQDIHGKLHGTTYQCGSNNQGTIWGVSTTGKGTLLHSFAGGASDGAYPLGGVVLDSMGNMYGATSAGGTSTKCAGGCGTLYKLKKSGTLTLLHKFDYTKGALPFGEMLRTTTGALSGTTYIGGSNGCYGDCGTVWEYVP
jgi:uncharacterized repeat protein (TIGR03803 family)